MSNMLVVLKGIPGSGKSTFIKNKGYDIYTVSTDTVRNLIAAPQQNENGEYKIYNSFEKQVNQLILDLVEKRLQRGELTFIDATNTKLTLWNKYKAIAEKYKTKIICLDFSHIDIETAKKQNKMRPEYKQVEDEVIERFQKQLDIMLFPEDIEVIKPEEWDSKFVWKKEDFSHYKKIHHFGDLHGCNEPLKQYFKDGLKDDELYIFVGDYIDRGTQNTEVLNFLFSIMNRKNVKILEGNHEIHLWKWSNNLPASSKEFQRHTMAELEKNKVSKKQARYLYKSLEKAVYYRYEEKTILVTHGGIVKIPNNLLALSSEQMIKGVGDYNTQIDELFTKKNEDKNTYQIHGHRNTYDLPIQAAERSFNLEGGIERGGSLRVLVLSKDGFTPIEIKNKTVSARYEKTEEKTFNNKDLLKSLRENRYIRETIQEHYPNISSFNFRRKVFTKGLWNNQTIKARGLFINTKTTEIVSRSYDKFFNISEQETSLETLKQKLKFPINLYFKENGFLGILGYDHYYKNIIYSTKNLIHSKHADYFRKLFFNNVSLQNEEKIMKILRDKNLSLVFEAIDPINDPHIIEYNKKPKLILLDAIFREEEFRKLPYETLKELGEELGFRSKEKADTFLNWSQFEEWYEKASNDFRLEIEGYVVEDQNGYMTKIKLPYYSFWKWMRAQVEKINAGFDPIPEAMNHPLGNQFLTWYLHLENKKTEDVNIIKLRNEFMEKGKIHLT